MQNRNASSKWHAESLQTEALLITVSRVLVHALSGPKGEEKSLAQLIKNNPGNEIPSFMLSPIAQHASQIIQIYRATAGEIKELVNRVEQLTSSA